MPVHLGVDCGYLTYRSLRSEVTEEQLKTAGFGIRVAERTDDLVIAHSRTPDVLEKAFSRHGEGIPMKHTGLCKLCQNSGDPSGTIEILRIVSALRRAQL